MAKLKFIGEWKRLEELGYVSNEKRAEEFIGCWKGVPDFSLWVWKNGIVSLIHYSEEVTAIIHQYLVQNDFETRESFGRLVYVKATNSVVPFEYSKHHVMGLYGMDYTQEDDLKYRGQFTHILVTEGMLSLFRELHENNLVEFVQE